MSNCRVGIIGGGVLGLSCALHIANEHGNLDITVISDKDPKQTTSVGPPGLFRPSMPSANATTRQWARDSFDHFLKLAKSAEGPKAGCQVVSGYLLSDDLPFLRAQEQDYSDIVANFRWLKEDDMKIFNVKFRHGCFYTATMAQTHYYVPWLAEKARLAGCEFINRTVDNIAELAYRYDFVINCAGLGARSLVPDDTVYPVRGIALRVVAPTIKNFLLCDDGMTYIMPGIDSVFLGTVRQENNWKTTIDLSERQAIIKRCTEIMPSLEQATLVDEWVGLRPFRFTPRLEIEHLDTKRGSQLPVIHNYGIGGHGITFSWGSACHVNRILTEELRIKKSKL